MNVTCTIATQNFQRLVCVEIHQNGSRSIINTGTRVLQAGAEQLEEGGTCLLF